MALTDKLTAIANAIRGKTGKTDSLTLDQMATEIEGIECGGFGEGANSILFDLLTATNTDYSSEEEFTVNCAALRNTVVKNVYLPNVTISSGMFEMCSSLETVVLKEVKKYPTGLFSGCTNMIKCEVGFYHGIGLSSFHNCSSLEHLKICGDSTFGFHYQGWFNNCKKLKTLILDIPKLAAVASDPLASTPIAASGTATDIEYGTGYIYVRKAYIEDYKAATNWAIYADRFRAIEDYPDICGEVTA